MSNASVLLPLPDTPVTTVKRLRGISTLMFFKLCSRALCTWMAASRCGIDATHRATGSFIGSGSFAFRGEVAIGSSFPSKGEGMGAPLEGEGAGASLEGEAISDDEGVRNAASYAF